MDSKEKIPNNVKNLLDINSDTFEGIMCDLAAMYKTGKFNMVFAGSASNILLSNEDAELMSKKYNLAPVKLYESLYAIVGAFHYLLFKEADQVSAMLSPADRENFSKKVQKISEMLAKYPSINQSFLISNTSKIPFYNALAWDAVIKVFHSPEDFATDIPIHPLGTIQLQLWDPRESPPEPVTCNFNIGLKEVENMIRLLEDLRLALTNLQNLEISKKDE